MFHKKKKCTFIKKKKMCDFQSHLRKPEFSGFDNGLKWG